MHTVLHNMTHLDKLQQTYMLAAFNTKEACSKQKYVDMTMYLSSKSEI